VLFREHLIELQKRAADGYIELLEEVRKAAVASLMCIPASELCRHLSRADYTIAKSVPTRCQDAVERSSIEVGLIQ
jgi:hypothetical protein